MMSIKEFIEHQAVSGCLADEDRQYLDLRDVEEVLRRARRNVWHTSDERPEDDSQVLIIDHNDLGTAGDYGAEGDYFAADAGGVCDDWNEWHITRWAYIKDLLPEEITEKDSKQ